MVLIELKKTLTQFENKLLVGSAFDLCLFGFSLIEFLFFL